MRDNGASRQVGVLEVRWMRNPTLRDGFAAPPERRGAEWKAWAKHANLYRWSSAFTI